MKKAFASDTAFKIYSVLIAILLWAFVVYNQNPESTKIVSGIKISYTNAAELESQGLVILKNDWEPTLDITIKGRRLSIGRVDSSNVSASVTVPEMRAGEYDVSINAALQFGDVSIIDQKPYRTKVVVEPLKSIEVPVEVKYSGNPKEAATSVQADVSPRAIAVSGPASVVDRVQSAAVTLDVSDAADGENIVQKYKLTAKDGSDLTGNVNLRVSTDAVAIVPAVYHIKDVAVEAQFSGTLPEGHAISSHIVSPVSVRLGSKDDAVQRIDKVLTEPVDVSALTGNGTVRAKLIIPEGITNIYSVTEVEIAVEVEQTVTKTVSIENVTFQNAESAKQYAASGLPVSMTFRGPKSTLDTFAPSARVDVAGVAEGTHTLPLRFELPEGVSLIGEALVQVTVGASSGQTSPPPSPTTTPQT
jgi:YbbR domain-containing protein